ncbi:hypothetical protein AXG93_2490s1590 [Marchantia polymorpha subsp. ruderalis]|uniref:Uncharacterized protein n=1 Tax=Marchantia polymorpha subsp. ruderalis TaxID=1480154 RepID=A0A176W5Q3_MARPO|nr:hypothetical protein AXG93_2490s1590 [Marchantia polymorpha subsp. ruderalis]
MPAQSRERYAGAGAGSSSGRILELCLSRVEGGGEEEEEEVEAGESERMKGAGAPRRERSGGRDEVVERKGQMRKKRAARRLLRISGSSRPVLSPPTRPSRTDSSDKPATDKAVDNGSSGRRGQPAPHPDDFRGHIRDRDA